MIKVIFSTNLDQYSRQMFQSSNTPWEFVPRVGDFVEVKTEYVATLRDKKLPIRLEVTSVSLREYVHDTIATVELWYNKTDLELAKLANAPVFG